MVHAKKIGKGGSDIVPLWVSQYYNLYYFVLHDNISINKKPGSELSSEYTFKLFIELILTQSTEVLHYGLT